jgi:hypothetical protein
MEWLCTQSAANSSLSAIPVCRENTGFPPVHLVPPAAERVFLQLVGELVPSSPIKRTGIFGGRIVELRRACREAALSIARARRSRNRAARSRRREGMPNHSQPPYSVTSPLFCRLCDAIRAGICISLFQV